MFSQQVLYNSLEQQGTKTENGGLNTNQRKEMKRQGLYREMRRRPLPLMSKGEEEQATEERILTGKQRKCIDINAKGGDC